MGDVSRTFKLVFRTIRRKESDMLNENLIELKDICKSFYGVEVLHHVNFSMKAGEVRGLLGENGAGKSTLMKVLNGIFPPNSGEIYVHGEKKVFREPDDARKSRISFIHQEIALSPNLSIAQNMYLGCELKKNKYFTDDATMVKAAQDVLNSLGLRLDARTLVEKLSIAQQQLVEIAKALMMDAELIVMDEPTATLSEQEVEYLFRQIERLRKKNIAIIYISHRLNEILRISDTLSVLRDGNLIATRSAEGVTQQELIEMMVGRQIENLYISEKAIGKEEIMSVEHLSNRNVKDISFTLRRGEILGFAGLVGAGRTELMQAIFGVDPIESGSIYIEGTPVKIRHPIDAIKNGIGLASENRKENGLILIQSVDYNVTLPVVNEFIKGISVNKKRENEIVDTYAHKLSIKMTSTKQLCQYLSGGNQQKVVISKWLATNAKILIFDEPTRGIDVGAKSEIYHLMKQLADSGISIIMVASELPEIINMSSRIAVMREGHLVTVMEKEEIDQYTEQELQVRIMQYATGGCDE